MTTNEKIIDKWIVAKDGTEIYTKTWKAVSEPPIATVVFLHGFAEHINRYDYVFEKFSKENIEVYAFDQRGFGQTAIKNNNPGVTSRWKVVTNDITEALIAQRRPGVPQFLMGHSMRLIVVMSQGGGLALNYACDGPEKNNLTGFIISSPLIQQPVQNRVNHNLVTIGNIVSKLLPSLTISIPLDPKTTSHDPEEVKKYSEDPLILRASTLRGIGEMLSGAKLILDKKYKSITSPIYICHGSADLITCPKSSKELYDKISSKDKTYREWEGLYHEMHNEIEKDKVIDDYIQWLVTRANKSPNVDDNKNSTPYTVNTNNNNTLEASSTMKVEMGINTTLPVDHISETDIYTITIFTFSTLLRWFFFLVSFVTITLSTWIIKLLSWSFTLQLNFVTLLVFFGLCSTIGYIVIRYRILTKYSRLPKESLQAQGATFDLQPNASGENEKSQTLYTDELLSAFFEGIKVFGYLEKPIFHELKRQLQTRKLSAGETLILEKERSFYIVVEGHVKVFVKTANEKGIVIDPFENNNHGYQLLNEVTDGGTLSSLFTILSLFTEDIELRYDDSYDNNLADRIKIDGDTLVQESTAKEEVDSDSKVKEDNKSDNKSDDAEKTQKSFGQISPQILKLLSKESWLTTSVQPNIIARATVDTTLAFIPAEAFHRLTEKFPNSAAHIVQVILTRFQRVTFWTGYKYLGLTKDLLRTEKLMNEIASHGLPSDFFRPGIMERLRMKHVGSNKKYIKDNRNEDMEMSDSGLINKVKKTRPFARPQVIYESDENNENIPLTNKDNGRSYSNSKYLVAPTRVQPTSGPQVGGRDYDAGDEMYLKESVLEGISKGIGLLQTNHKEKINSFDQKSRPSSVESNNSPFTKYSTSSAHSSTTALDIPDDDSVAETVPSLTSELDNDVEILYYPKGSVIVTEGERDVGLFFVIDGLLDVSVTSNDKDFLGSSFSHLDTSGSIPSSPIKPMHKKKESISFNSSNRSRDRSLFMIKPGGIAGYLAALTGFPSFVSIRASTDTYVGFLPKNSLNRIMERNPIVLLTLAKRLTRLLSPLVLHIDYALDWVHVNAGQVLYREGDLSDSIYIVLNGRVRTINEQQNGVIDILGEYGQGQSVGELEVMTGTPRPHTLHAIRDTELARMPRTLFNALALRHPEITLQISRIIASRTRSQQDQDYNHKNAGAEFGKNNKNLKTVGILPVSGNVPVGEFAKKLKVALERSGETATLLNQASVVAVLGKHAFTQMGRLKLISWLAEQEEKSRIVLYLADGGLNSSWTQNCIRQADCIFLVGLGDGDATIGEYESLLIGTKTTARKELVLLHPERYCSSGTTRQWLKNRHWIHAHHHVQMTIKKPTMLEESRKNTLMTLRDQIRQFYTRKRSPAIYTGNRSDFSRLARRLCGKSVGLVLGGGGARGISHIGVIKALDEAGIPIDMVGGTSIGSLIGGLYARDSDNVAILGRAKAFAARMSSKWRQIFDLTYPVTAWFTGHGFNRGIWKIFLDTQIEDFWLSYFCVTTNITWSRMEVHKWGYAWRYIRASMSLSAFLPPLCDNGHLLVDGGYMDNLPVGVMKSMGADTIFAVDVASNDDTSPVYYGDSISGWWVLLTRWNPFNRAAKIPTIADIQSRLAYVSSVKTLEEAKLIPGCLYMKLPVQQYGTLEFNKFDEIFEVGYKAGKEMLKKFKEEGKLGNLLDQGHDNVKRNRVRRRNSV
ncbi:7489_t:CDS:10 [Acaulospora morrowiae]|uniref:Lysophospholipase NTE1 n=1 Tax=Acaulospora morrowiae TaxID=94023 RepID=A0A9N8V9I1_9GLOM|nr:7489_t:CDS:10 [Acaulospora morrowiae]